MKIDKKSRNETELIQSLEDGQKNLLVPDLIRNSRNVDDALWNGSDKTPLVQRIGFVTIGLLLLVCGAAMASYPNRGHYVLQTVITLAFVYSGLKVAWNGIRKFKSDAGQVRSKS